MNQTFRKLFVSGSSNLTTQEKDFLDGCDFRVYLISGNGSTSVETFKGYSGFIQHIKKGVFNQEEPGSPLFCTFNHVKDNSPVSIKFKYSIKKEPVYLELKWKRISTSNKYDIQDKGDLIVKFYRNKSKIPTIAPPNMKINLQKTFVETGPGATYKIPSHQNFVFQNAGYQTSMVLLTNQYTTRKIPGRRDGSPYDGWTFEPPYDMNQSFLLQTSNEYVIIGYNPIDGTSAQFATP